MTDFTNNYRICFGGSLKVDYKNDFEKCRKYFPLLKEIYSYFDLCKVKYKWHHFEPYCELTWISDIHSEGMIDYVKNLIDTAGFSIEQTYTPSDGIFADWYYENLEELEFCCKRLTLESAC